MPSRWTVHRVAGLFILECRAGGPGWTLACGKRCRDHRAGSRACGVIGNHPLWDRWDRDGSSARCAMRRARGRRASVPVALRRVRQRRHHRRHKPRDWNLGGDARVTWGRRWSQRPDIFAAGGGFTHGGLTVQVAGGAGGQADNVADEGHGTRSPSLGRSLGCRHGRMWHGLGHRKDRLQRRQHGSFRLSLADWWTNQAVPGATSPPGHIPDHRGRSEVPGFECHYASLALQLRETVS